MVVVSTPAVGNLCWKAAQFRTVAKIYATHTCKHSQVSLRWHPHHLSSAWKWNEIILSLNRLSLIYKWVAILTEVGRKTVSDQDSWLRNAA